MTLFAWYDGCNHSCSNSRHFTTLLLLQLITLPLSGCRLQWPLLVATMTRVLARSAPRAPTLMR